MQDVEELMLPQGTLEPVPEVPGALGTQGL